MAEASGFRMQAAGADRALGPLRRLIHCWALAGGLLLLLLALLTSWSAFAGVVFSRPLPGDFELMELGVAIAAFTFLPYCQLIDANVSADLFTAGAGPRMLVALKVLSAIIALAFALLLLWRMSDGLAGYLRYEEVTTILKIPIWTVFIPALFSLALLAIAALISIRDALRDAAR